MKTLFLVLFPALLFAQSSSEHFTLAKSVMDAGGGKSSSANFSLLSAFGQPTPIGVQSSANFTLYAGFLSPYAVSPLSPIQELVIWAASHDAHLHWEAVPNANSYDVYRDTDPLFTPGPGNHLATVTDTFYVDLNVPVLPNERYYYSVAPSHIEPTLITNSETPSSKRER